MSSETASPSATKTAERPDAGKHFSVNFKPLTDSDSGPMRFAASVSSSVREDDR